MRGALHDELPKASGAESDVTQALVAEAHVYNPQNEACGTSQTKRTPTHPAEKKRSVTFSGNIPRAFGNHPNALLASVK